MLDRHCTVYRCVQLTEEELMVRAGLDGPSVPVRVEPVKFPEPEPRVEPAPTPVEQPEREPVEVPS